MADARFGGLAVYRSYLGPVALAERPIVCVGQHHLAEQLVQLLPARSRRVRGVPTGRASSCRYTSGHRSERAQPKGHSPAGVDAEFPDTGVSLVPRSKLRLGGLVACTGPTV